MITTTLADIRELPFFPDSWKKLLKALGVSRANKKPLPLERILEINGFEEALEALYAVQGHDAAIKLFARYCARYSLDLFERTYPDDKRPREAIETAERFARGEATNEELTAARAAANAASEAAWVAVHTARAAANAAWAAWCAAWTGDAAWVAEDAVRGAKDATENAWNAANRTKFAKDVAKATRDAGDAAKAIRDDFKREFIRLCRLEGEYGEVSRQAAQKLVLRL